MSKHTPGPWEVDGVKFQGGYYFAQDNHLILGSAYREADAHLIAAAPEMLAALRELVDDIEGPYAYDDDFKRIPMELERRITTLIAKAKGEAQ